MKAYVIYVLLAAFLFFALGALAFQLTMMPGLQGGAGALYFLTAVGLGVLLLVSLRLALLHRNTTAVRFHAYQALLFGSLGAVLYLLTFPLGWFIILPLLFLIGISWMEVRRG
ncbi:hypothetical protein [Alkalicoccus chagannorensis]|uniref:hypothetical protein n=1 Tax=Alkalicoccus chagannorensis TaxID=427072 RepID=UPI0003FE636C|nr:hypothetical protein [Alkalicoccus chagannorensis]